MTQELFHKLSRIIAIDEVGAGQDIEQKRNVGFDADNRGRFQSRPHFEMARGLEGA